MAASNQRLQRFARDRRGNVSIIFALTAIPVFGMVAMAVDYGRAVNAKTQLQNATDSAALIAVRLTGGDEQARIEAAKKTFAANYRPYGQTQVAPSIVFDGGTVRVTATDYVPTSIAGLAGIEEFTVNAQSGATMLSGKKLELSMMIDLTGSMSQTRNGQTKLSGLKEAAADLLDILFPNDAVTSDSVRIPIAPFADYVNAGEWAPAATGLPATGGPYANITNLGSTRQANFRGTYTGAIMNTPGSQVGATPVSTTYPGQITTAGTTYSNGYCAVSTVTTTVSIRQYNGRNTGESVSRVDPYYSNPYSGDAPAGMLKATSTNRYYDINKYRSSGWDFEDDSTSSGYYVPLLTSTTGLTIQTRTGWTGYSNKSGNIGQAISYDSNPPAPALRASTSPNGGYWHVTSIDTDGSLNYEWRTSGYYLPMYTSLGGTSTVPGCESAAPAQPTSKLIGCVTERQGTQAYTDASPSSAPVGAFNHGVTSVYNYSSDGECWVAGRKMPSIIPMTDDRSTLQSFFTTATAGGATPGHIGTAWSWYLISPEWNGVWPSASQAVPYGTPNVMKVAVLMTDGEYNIHYASASARTQALALCEAMKAKGITVYTVGFGFAENTVADANGTTDQRAKDLLQRCASNSSTYFFPYDGEQLRRDFKAIGALLMGEMQSDTAKLID